MASNTARTLQASDRASIQLGNNHNNYYKIYNIIDLTTDTDDETSDETVDLTEDEIPDLAQDAPDLYVGGKRARDWDSDDHKSKRLKFLDDDASESSSESGYDEGDSDDEDKHCKYGEDCVGLSTGDEGEEDSDEEHE
ncbi:hypothetical protein LRP88_00081 [Fusarium phalaenopsidis]